MLRDWPSDSYVAQAIEYATCDEGRVLIMGRARAAAHDKWLEMSVKYCVPTKQLKSLFPLVPLTEDIVMAPVTPVVEQSMVEVKRSQLVL